MAGQGSYHHGVGRSGQTSTGIQRTIPPRSDSAVHAGLMRTPEPDLRGQVLNAISRQLAFNQNERQVSSLLLPGKDKRGAVRLELEKLAGEGVLERRCILGCPECGEFEDRSYKNPLALEELPVGKEFRCKESGCKHVYTAQHHDFYCTYVIPADFKPTIDVSDPRIGRDHRKDRAAIEKAVKKRLRSNATPFYASEIEQELDVPGMIVRANLATMVRLRELAEHDVERCPSCGHELCSDTHEIQVARIGCLEVCPECNHGPFVVSEADVYVSYDKPETRKSSHSRGFAETIGF